jgi:hypothetical protein
MHNQLLLPKLGLSQSLPLHVILEVQGWMPWRDTHNMKHPPLHLKEPPLRSNTPSY